MLLELKVENFLTITFAHLTFDEGFTVFTGETGAGKSVLLKAILLILGDRGGQNLVNPQADTAEIEALIYGGEVLAKRLEEIGLKPEEEVHIRRIISTNRQRVYLNGSPVSLSELQILTKGLIELTSQHEFYTLFDRKNQLHLYDTLIGLRQTVSLYQQKFERLKSLNREITVLEEKLRHTALRRDYLEFQLKEIEELNPSQEEEDTLQSLRNRLKNLSAIRDTASELLSFFTLVEAPLRQSLMLLERLTRFEANLKDRITLLETLYYELKDLESEVSKILSDLPEDTQSLDEIEARLARYDRLKRKYQTTTEGLLRLKEEIKLELSTLETGEDRLNFLLKERESLLEELYNLADELNQARRQGKVELEERLKAELSQLGMKGAALILNLKTKEKRPENLMDHGLDELELLFLSNPGLPARPLEKIASGGEISRIYLILRSLLSVHAGGTLIFDEVDAGVGGVMAQKVGEKLRSLAETHQVLCITHLPQIARLADHHFLVEKKQDEETTRTVIRRLSPDERLRELARMLGEPEDLALAQKLLKS